MNEYNGTCPPELFVRLRLLGFTTAAIESFEHLFGRNPNYSWPHYTEAVESDPNSAQHAAYWNKYAKEKLNG